jgi:hypothetical protein
MAAPQVTLLDQLLQQIITESGNGYTEMGALNAQVQSAGDIIRTAQISDSGSVIVRRLQVWNEDWQGIAARLQDLNTRVTNMRTSLLRGLEDALLAAQGS